MPITVGWHIENRVIEMQAEGQVLVADVVAWIDEQSKLLAQAQDKTPETLVYTLHDATDAESYPPIYLMVKRALPVLRFKNRGPIFLVTQAPKIRSVFALTSHVMDFPVHVFSTRDDALNAIQIAIAKEDMYSLD